MSDTTTTLVQRASARLHALLDGSGIATHPLVRNRHLAAELRLSLQESEALLSGLVPWNMGQLDKICQHFGQRPGYFLDPDVNMSLPADASTVTSTDGGEPIVWRIPSGYRQHAPDSKPLNYFTILSRSHFGGEPVPTALIYQSMSDLEQVVPFQQHNIGYIVADESGARRPAICTKVSSRHVQFESLSGSSPPLLLPLNQHDLRMGGAQVIGRAVGTVSYLC